MGAARRRRPLCPRGLMEMVYSTEEFRLSRFHVGFLMDISPNKTVVS